MRVKLQMDKTDLVGKIDLPASKSISNRMLILNALAEHPGKLENLSDSDDTRVMEEALAKAGRKGKQTIDIGHAGTAMRFLTAYLSIREGTYVLTGSHRMKQRPVGKLVDALNSLGARITYLETPGYPPLLIRGTPLDGGRVSVDSSVSSQFISALMMIGPVLREGLVIQLENEIVSSSYIRLTKDLMCEMGIPVNLSGNRIEIPFRPFAAGDRIIEADWSASGYWFAMAALSGGVHMVINGLRKGSSQGDAVLPEIFRSFGVRTTYREEGILLERIPSFLERFEFDFSDNPDLVQTLAVLCGLRGIPFRMTGTRTLKIKETDRIHALQVEMRKLGIELQAGTGGAWIEWDGEKTPDLPHEIRISTYRDHRMAMAFSPAALIHPGLIIEDPEVVSKSYPGFWKDLENVGFRVVAAE